MSTTTHSITLYGAHGSCSVAPEALLRHLGLPFSYKSMTIAPTGGIQSVDGTITPSEYKTKIHPGELVPALKVDEEAITENQAVIHMIVLLSKKTEFLGRSALEQARVTEWMAWLAAKVHGQGFGGLWRPGRYTDSEDEKTLEGVKDKGRKTVDYNFGRIEAALTEKKRKDEEEGNNSSKGFFAVGQNLTVVDFYLYVFATWGFRIGIDMKALYPNYMELVKGMEKLDAIKETQRENGKELVASD